MLLVLSKKGLIGVSHGCFYRFRSRSPSASSHYRVFSDTLSDFVLFRGLLQSPWSTTQRCGVKVLGSDVRAGDIIQRKGHVYEVVKAQHTQQGRGGATIQVEFREIDKGTKMIERLRTDEPLETIFVEDKQYSYLYTEGGNIILMDPTTFEQIDVPEQLFGKASAYLEEDMTVSVQFYDGRVTSASIPRRVTCTVANADGTMVSSLYKKVVLDNGIAIQAPHFVETGDQIVVDTVEHSYVTSPSADMGRVSYPDSSSPQS